MEQIISLTIVIIRFVLLSHSLLNSVFVSHSFSFSDSSSFVFPYPNNGVLYCLENDRNWLVGVYTPTALIPKKELILFTAYICYSLPFEMTRILTYFAEVRTPSRNPVSQPRFRGRHSSSSNLPKITVKISSNLLFSDGRLRNQFLERERK
jgi:hypothetical protein